MKGDAPFRAGEATSPAAQGTREVTRQWSEQANSIAKDGVRSLTGALKGTVVAWRRLGGCLSDPPITLGLDRMTNRLHSHSWGFPGCGPTHW